MGAFSDVSFAAARVLAMSAGVVLTAAVLAWTAGAWMPARFEARVSRRRLTMTGMLLVLVSILATASVLDAAASSRYRYGQGPVTGKPGAPRSTQSGPMRTVLAQILSGCCGIFRASAASRQSKVPAGAAR